MNTSATNLLFGVGPEIYMLPEGAAIALSQVPEDSVGAELIPISDAFVRVDPENGKYFKNWFRVYKEALKRNDADDVNEALLQMALFLREIPREKWKEILHRLEKTGWALSGGFFASPKATEGGIQRILSELSDEFPLIPLRFSQSIPVNNPQEIRKEIERALDSTHPYFRIPTFTFEGSWPAEEAFQIAPDKIEAARQQEIYLVGLIQVPKEQRSVGVYIHQKRGGDWGLYFFSKFDQSVKESVWHSLLLTTQIVELGVDPENISNPFFLAALHEWNFLKSKDKNKEREKTQSRLLSQKTNGAREFQWRAQQNPILYRWLALNVDETLEVPSEELLKDWPKQFTSALSFLLKPLYLLKDRPELRERYITILKDLGFTEISQDPLDNNVAATIETEDGLFTPRKIIPLSEFDLKRVSDFLEELNGLGIFKKQDLNMALIELLRAWALSKDYPELKTKEKIPFRYSLWSRLPFPHGAIQIPSGIAEDLSRQVLYVTLPNGEPIFAFVMCLMEDLFGKLWLFYSVNQSNPPITHHFDNDSLLKKSHEVVGKIAAQLRIPKGRTLYSETGTDINWVQGIFPVTAHWDTRHSAYSLLSDWPHPYQSLFPLGQGSYEAMRLAQGARRLFLNPSFNPYPGGVTLPFFDFHTHPRSLMKIDGFTTNWDIVFDEITHFLLREIDPEPDPQMRSAKEYLLGFSTDTGRSIDYATDYIGPDGTHWYHLSAIGAGKTLKARNGSERRDGVLPLEGAQRRLYMTMAMHTMALQFGFRTSLAVAVVDRGKIREESEKVPGTPQRQATLYELRREQLRLGDLDNVLSVRETLDIVKAKIAKELGKEILSDEEYVAWLAKMLGGQFGIMLFFGFDHGEFERSPQLHDRNVSLAGEIFDFDVAKFTKNAEVLFNRYFRDNEVSVNSIKNRQQDWKEKKGEKNWLTILLDLAPNVEFAQIVEATYFEKLRELEAKGIDPEALRDKFNREVWNRYMRSLKRNPQEIYGAGEAK